MQKLIPLLLAVAPMYLTASAAERTVPTSPHARLRAVDATDVRWTDGLWAEKFELCRRVMIPGVERALHHPENAACLDNFLVAAGIQEGSHRGTNWGDGDCYKWLEAVARVYAITGDEPLDRLMDRWIEAIAKAQQPDGYLSTNIQLTGKERLANPHHHEMYNMGHLLTAACVHHRATGKESFLDVARKLGDFLDDTFSPRPPELAHFGWNPSNIMGLVDLYRTTGQEKYLRLAKTFVDMRGSAPGGSDLTQDHVPLREETEAVGHCVCAMYLYCGAADVFVETGEKALAEALDRLWQDATTRKMYITGANAAMAGGRSIRGDSVHEAFGAAYHLPNRTGYNETCANIGSAMWNRRLLAVSGDARHADEIERVLYNGLLAAVGAEGKDFFYANPLKCDQSTAGLSRNHTLQRWSIHRCYCCPVQVIRTIAKVQGWTYGVSPQGIWVHLYGGNELRTTLADGSPVRLVQQTDYPWDGRVKITVRQCPRRQFALMLRIPGWADTATIRVNGESWPGETTGGTYAAVRRTWAVGDVVELEMPMRVRLIESHPAVEENRNYVAVARGPVVYCVELPVDQEGEEKWKTGVFLPENATFAPRHDAEFLGGVTVLQGTALTFAGRDRFVEKTAAVKVPVDSRDWDGVLYREFRPRKLPPATGGTVPVTLIPYFAWANRGPSYMEVWIPLAR